MEPEKILNSQSNIENENQSWRHHNSRLQAVLQSCNHQKSIKYWHKNRHIDQQKKIENPEMDPQMYGQLVVDKAGKNIQLKKTVSLANGAGKTGQRHTEE